MRIALLAALKMKAEACSKAKVMDFLLDEQIRYVQEQKSGEEIEEEQLRKYLAGKPRGYTPEHYLTGDKTPFPRLRDKSRIGKNGLGLN